MKKDKKVFDTNNIFSMRDYESEKVKQKKSNVSEMNRESVSQPEYNLAVRIEQPGNINDIFIEKRNRLELQEDELEIEVKAFSLNFGDLLSVKGLYPNMPDYPFTPGMEVSGIVARIGKNVKGLSIGEEVIGLTNIHMGGHASYVTLSENFVAPKPENVSYEEACAFPVVFITMYHAFQKAEVKKGDRILIQTATGGTGLIAVQLARHLGCEIVATAGSEEKLEYLQELGVDKVLNYQKEGFEESVRKLTEGYGVDVVINTLAAPYIQMGLNLLAPEGRYVEIAMQGVKSSKNMDLSHLVDNQTVISIDITRLMRRNPKLVREYMKFMSDYLEKQIVTPTICNVFLFKNYKEAYHYLENRKNIGKIVVTVDSTELQSVESNDKIKKENLKEAVTDKIVTDTDIAVIGIAGRFPGCENTEEFWHALQSGKNLITKIPKSRWDIDQYYDENIAIRDKTNCQYGGFLSDIDKFDATFFQMSGKEAYMCDPQQRLFLQECYHAIEDAGYSPEELGDKKCGVYAGFNTGDYSELLEKDKYSSHAFIGNSTAISSARLSYYLNLKGACVSIDTACSSSLVALHLACKSLINGENEMCIVGGSFITETPKFYISCSNSGMLSPDGKCHTFDNDANGFVPGESAAAILVKPYQKAKEDGDHIYGIIKGSMINQDGVSNGITAPSSVSQERLELELFKTYGINPETISYVEAHGTGTKLGDPIEWNALTDAFRKYTDKKKFCAIGSVKTNMGHAITSAGIVSVIKVLLCMQHKQLPPSLHFHKGNEHIDFEDTPFYVNESLKDWNPVFYEKRRATVSSFGFSGTNCYVLLEETPD